MPPRITIILDCADPATLKRFWLPALGYIEIEWHDDTYAIMVSDEGPAPVVALQKVPEPKMGKNRMHIDLHAPDLEAEVARLEALGATRGADQRVEGGATWIVMADPEGNEFCVVSP